MFNKTQGGNSTMKLLPIGIENFKTLIEKDCYYIDKTNLIADVLSDQIALYTRPRRFYRRHASQVRH